MDFRLTGLPAEPFLPLYGLDDDALAARGARRVIADAHPGYPCRVSLEDAPAGAALILLNWPHLEGPTPYRGAGPIFVREGARQAFDAVNVVPPQQHTRLLSVRAYDADGWMRDADVVEGVVLEPLIARLFGDPRVQFLQVHNARRGCYACRVERA